MCGPHLSVFLGTRQLGLGVVCGCLLRREQALPIGTVTRMVSAGVQIGCVWATPICFFGNQTIGSGCSVWLSAQEGAGSPHRYSHQDGQCRCTDRVCVGHTYLFFLGTRQLGLGVVCGCLLRREQALPIGTVTRMVSAGVQIGCVWATPICFFWEPDNWVWV